VRKKKTVPPMRFYGPQNNGGWEPLRCKEKVWGEGRNNRKGKVMHGGGSAREITFQKGKKDPKESTGGSQGVRGRGGGEGPPPR